VAHDTALERHHDIEEPMTVTLSAPLLDRWVVVSGGSKGIGLGIAHELRRQGAHVVLTARGEQALEAAREECLALPAPDAAAEVLTARCDISDERSVRELFAGLRERTPGLDGVVANAGTGGLTPFLELEATEFDRIVATNLRGTFLIVQAAAREMIDRPRPDLSIVVVSSIRAKQYRPGVLPYAASKAGVDQLVRGAAYELAPHRIRVNAVAPGMTLTPLMLAGTPDVERIAAERVPFGRAGVPADTARATAFLCSDAASFVTGANLAVDGGESLL
jgi:NAD(P)-dependent dehydrogenase (short-subunit alcohol dehydrogenase family)